MTLVEEEEAHSHAAPLARVIFGRLQLACGYCAARARRPGAEREGRSAQEGCARPARAGLKTYRKYSPITGLAGNRADGVIVPVHTCGMEQIQPQGSWWLPTYPEHRIPGAVTIHADGIDLELHGELTPYVAPEPVGGVIDHKIGGLEWTTVPIIHGRTQDGQDVTLFNAGGINPKGPFNDVIEHYKVELLLNGGHVEADEFYEVVIEFDWLDAWLQPPSITGSDPIKPDLDFVELMPITLAEIQLDDARITFQVDAVGSYDDSEIHLDRRSSVRITLSESKDWKSILQEWVRPMQDFFTVCLGRTVELTNILFGMSADADGAHLLSGRLRILQPTPLGVVPSRRSASEIYNYTSPTLVTLRDSSVDIADLVAGWFATWRRHSGSIPLLLSHQYAPFMYSSHVYNSVFQSVEGVHKTKYPGGELDEAAHSARVQAVLAACNKDGVATEVVEWAERVLQAANNKRLVQRITEILTGAGEAGQQILKTVPKFARTAAGLRNQSSHPGSTRRASDARMRFWYGEILSWIVRVELLTEAGLSDAPLRASNHFSFREAIDQAGGTA